MPLLEHSEKPSNCSQPTSLCRRFRPVLFAIECRDEFLLMPMALAARRIGCRLSYKILQDILSIHWQPPQSGLFSSYI
jgi:hypothetical protein